MINIAHKLFVAVIFLLVFNVICLFAYANDSVFEENGCKFYYYIQDNKVVIDLIDIYNAKQLDNWTVVIPSRIDGRKVVKINKSAAHGTADHEVLSIKKVICSDYMTKVDMMSFHPMQSLQEIVLGKYTKSFISLFLDYEKDECVLFKITTPKDAKYLKTVKGALYSKDGSILFKTPKVSKTGYKDDDWRSFKASSNVKRIYKYAFLNNSHKVIKLGGHLRKIDKGAFKNSGGILFKVPKNKVKKYKTLIKKAGGKLGNTEWKIRVKGY